MPMDPPPSRYRVVERGGRLVVIDSVVGGAPPTARELLPEVTSDSAAERFESFFRDGADTQAGPLPPQRPAAAQAMIAAPPGVLRNVAATVCGDRRDRDGRLQLKTARWFDAKGPRTVALSENGARQLGLVVLALVVAVIVAVFLVVLWSVVGWAFVIVGVVALRQMKPAVTAWIDRLTQQ